MINKKLITSFILSTTICISVLGQEKNNSATQKTLKQAFSGKFLIGCADDLNIQFEAYQTSIRTQYDIVTPENCMKPQPIHPTGGYI